MRHSTLTSALTTLTLIHTSIAGYALVDDYSKDTFFGNFTAFSQKDPTNGYVQYNNYQDANSKNLIKTVPNANFASYLTASPSDPSTSGRDSIRISSKKTYNHGLFIVDLLHMPASVCGSWPAFWLLGSGTWPTNGEIDIIEGVNLADRNQMTLHTSSGCSLEKSATGFSGSVKTSNCGPDEENSGCAITAKDAAGFGQGFNQGNGGVYATEWTEHGISIWFFGRGNVPEDIKLGKPEPGKWGTPAAKFAGKGCEWDKHFRDMNIVFNTAFCGDWAGKVWQSGGCAKATGVESCEEFVKGKGEAFKESFWLVNYVKVFQEQGGQQQQLQKGGSGGQAQEMQLAQQQVGREQQKQQQGQRGGVKMRRGERSALEEVMEDGIL